MIRVQTCPLCQGKDITSYHEDKKRSYLHCRTCDLVFVPAQFWLSAKVEKAEYDLHENNPDDPGYRKFLSRLADPLLKKLLPNQSGLDFGCGSGPTLSVMMQEQSHQMAIYDHFYYNYPEVLNQKYDFITATEVVEHLQNPSQVLTTLFNLLRPGGWLGVMTKLVQNRDAFRHWHYTHDMTHISFYSRNTMNYLAKRFGAKITFIGKDVILFQKIEKRKKPRINTNWD